MGRAGLVHERDARREHRRWHWYAKFTLANVGPTPATNEGSVVTRRMVERNVAKVDQAAQDVRHLSDHGVRQHLGALTNPEPGTMSRVRSDGPVPVLRQ